MVPAPRVRTPRARRGAIQMKGGEQYGETSKEKSRLGCCSAQGVGDASRERSQVQAHKKRRVIVPSLRARAKRARSGEQLAPQNN